MANSSFFTQACNFMSAISGKVDPRTGTFNLNMNLGTVNGNNQLGPKFPVVLSYSPLVKDDIGFGIGVTLGITRYDKGEDKNTLFLSTGEQYTIEETGDEVFVNQKKLNNFKFTKLSVGDDNGVYQIIHKKGDIEIIRDNGTNEMINVAGHKLNINHVFVNGEQRLDSIVDGLGVTLLKLEYFDDSDTVRFDFYPDSDKEGYKVELITNGDYVQTVSIITDTQTLTWQLSYDDVDLPNIDEGNTWYWVTKLTTPTGMVEEAQYTTGDQGLKFPDSFPDQLTKHPYPYVNTFTQTPKGNQPKITATYEFYYMDDNGEQHFTNYLGYGSDAEYSSYYDVLYDVVVDYKYGSIETRVVDNQTTVITRVYNNYHLLLSETHQTGDKISKKETVYYAQPYKRFKAQPAIFQMPAKTITTWTDGGNTYVEQTISEIDGVSFEGVNDAPTDNANGNPSKKVKSDGTTTVWEYYEASGEDNDDEAGTGCPPAPNGFKRFIKSMTVTAPKNELNTVNSHKTVYRYANFPFVGSDVEALVIKAQETHYADDKKLKTIRYDYDSGLNAGRLKSKLTTHHGENDGYVETETYTRDNADGSDAYVKTFTLTSPTNNGHPELTVTHTQTHSKLTGRMWSQQDIQGDITTFEYDKLGRKTKRTLNPGTQYENIMNYEYIIDPDSEVPLYVITTDILGNKKRHALDSAHRHLHIESNDVDKNGVESDDNVTWYKLHEQNYDEQGRKLSATVSDYIVSSRDSKDSASENLSQSLVYDDWGHEKQSIFTDGIYHLTHHDPINLTTITQEYGVAPNSTEKIFGSLTKTTYEKHTHNIIKIEVYEATNKPGELGKLLSTVTHKYDGWKHLRSETVPDATDNTTPSRGGSTTTYDYDIWGRVTTTTLPDGKQIIKKYADFSHKKLVIEIGLQVASTYYKQGSQTYDYFGRLTQKISADRTWVYKYDKASDHHATSIIAPDNKTHKYTYIKELGDKPSTLLADSIKQTFAYNKQTGALTSCLANDEQGEHKIEYSYYTSGLHKSHTVTRGNEIVKYEVQGYTVAGKVHAAQDFSGASQIIERDQYGRVKKQIDGNVVTVASWDGLGRLSSFIVTDKSNNSVRETSLSYDSQGREISRTITDNNDTTNALVISQTWHINHQVASRTTKQGDTILRNETYTYNNRNQLTEYKVEGSALPSDSTVGGSQGIKSQEFTFTDLGNIKTRKTNYNSSGLLKQNVTTFYYENADKCQLSRLTNSNGLFSPTTITFKYDTAGRMITDEKQRTRQYDELGRLINVLDAQKNQLISYNYDAHNRMSLLQTDSTATNHYYNGDSLSYLTNSSNTVRLVRAAGHTVAQERSGQDNAGVWLTGTDSMGSVLNVRNEDNVENYSYTPYGEKGK